MRLVPSALRVTSAVPDEENARPAVLTRELCLHPPKLFCNQVEYVFSDKTGTLTSNEMQLRMIAIKGVPYGTLDFR